MRFLLTSFSQEMRLFFFLLWLSLQLSAPSACPHPWVPKGLDSPLGHSAQAWACFSLAYPGTTAAALGTQRHMKFLSSIVFSLWISLCLAIGSKAERTLLLSHPMCCRVRVQCPAGGLAAQFGGRVRWMRWDLAGRRHGSVLGKG